MILKEWFSYWYKEGLRDCWLWFRFLITSEINFFSIPLLFKTLFAPWKKDQIVAQGLSLQETIQVLALNFVSRLVGFMIRIVVLFLSLVALLLLLLIAAFILTLWLILPFLVIGLIIFSFLAKK
jgi:sensor histidine kinase YesM